MKKMYKVWAIWQICEAIILLAAGVLTIIFSQDNDFRKWIFVAIGSFVILDGTLRILMPFFNKDPGDNSLFTGIFEVAFGIVVIRFSAEITEIVMFFISTLLLVVAPVAIADGIIRIKKKQEMLFFPVLEFIAAALFISVGVVILVAISSAPNIVLIVVGAILIILAIVEIVFTVKTLLKVKERDKREKGKADEKEKKKKVVKKEVLEPVIVEEGEAFPVDKVE
ncbi:MAG: hypothetical protein WC344_02275 [Bacilli bacterium]